MTFNHDEKRWISIFSADTSGQYCAAARQRWEVDHAATMFDVGDVAPSPAKEIFYLTGQGFLSLNKNCRLKKIDLEVIDTAAQISCGKTSLGIYEVDGDTLTIIATDPGDPLRPLSFDEPCKSSEFFFTKK